MLNAKQLYYKKYYLDNRSKLIDYQYRRQIILNNNLDERKKRNLYKKKYYKENKEKIKINNKLSYNNRIEFYRNRIPKKHIIKKDLSFNVSFD